MTILFSSCLHSPLGVLTAIFLVGASYSHKANAFLLKNGATRQTSGNQFRAVIAYNKANNLENEVTLDISRRDSLALPAVLTAQLFSASVLLIPQRTRAATNQDTSKEKFAAARKSIEYLVDHYDEISKGGGDNVRRYLGTVVTDAPMVGIMKVLKELQKEADDIVEYTENMDAFEYSLRAADTAVYSANFVTFSSAKTKPEEYFDNAYKEIKKMLTSMDKMAAELNLKS